MAESERTLRTNLQALRERNIECEDLKEELSRMELQEKMAHAVTEITVLHHTLGNMTKELQASLSNQKHKKSALVTRSELHQPPNSFIDRVMVALAAEKEEDVRPDSPSGKYVNGTKILILKHSKFSHFSVNFPLKRYFYVVEAELRKEVMELRRSLQHSRVEAHFLREELRKAGEPSAGPVHHMEEKIQLLKEVTAH
ncbi:hypothetical protein XENOCAPTIV_013446 [Xenoophorus captivus]|uniref:Uncharacterized protein n=1 Tax=Xenoophorus captivus TaxID=1517983 RepID=A0ABV0S7E1_9TELE